MSAAKKAGMRTSGSPFKIEPTPRPVCRIFDRCEGCPYPAHGFVCWGPEEKCLRSEVEKIYTPKEGLK